jgi:hypothetical protein
MWVVSIGDTIAESYIIFGLEEDEGHWLGLCMLASQSFVRLSQIGDVMIPRGIAFLVRVVHLKREVSFWDPKRKYDFLMMIGQYDSRVFVHSACLINAQGQKRDY